ncbi:hypothetical protein SELMODRAFT_428061 [Selaginella moellendorffii]|uniref:Bulb-type lectin domain-containing protein n=1 Tax=Selaginella moellendorffii TaxID=88036 RepID=D8T1K6_SELML|nr:hypothetical protein SELMODRAFT_428061 [Selaginella moellendorffii]
MILMLLLLWVVHAPPSYPYHPQPLTIFRRNIRGLSLSRFRTGMRQLVQHIYRVYSDNQQIQVGGSILDVWFGNHTRLRFNLHLNAPLAVNNQFLICVADPSIPYIFRPIYIFMDAASDPNSLTFCGCIRTEYLHFAIDYQLVVYNHRTLYAKNSFMIYGSNLYVRNSSVINGGSLYTRSSSMIITDETDGDQGSCWSFESSLVGSQAKVPGSYLLQGNSINSLNGLYRLTLRIDCRLALRKKSNHQEIWVSKHDYHPSAGCYAIQQQDGNLVIKDSYGNVFWAAGVYCKPQPDCIVLSSVVVRGEGNVFIYNLETRQIWWQALS